MCTCWMKNVLKAGCHPPYGPHLQTLNFTALWKTKQVTVWPKPWYKPSLQEGNYFLMHSVTLYFDLLFLINSLTCDVFCLVCLQPPSPSSSPPLFYLLPLLCTFYNVQWHVSVDKDKFFTHCNKKMTWIPATTQHWVVNCKVECILCVSLLLYLPQDVWLGFIFYDIFLQHPQSLFQSLERSAGL